MGHWYDKEGKPQHFIVGANGKQRDTTLRDARKHGYFPSVTGIIDTLDKPALNRWKEKQILLAALTLPKVQNEPLDAFSKRVMEDAYKESTQARDKGSAIHDSIESIWKGDEPKNHATIAHKAVNAIIEYCGTDAFNAEKTVVGNGYGGMIDLHNESFVIDYKTKDIKDISTRLAYPEMCMQLSAYNNALRSANRKLINVFVDRSEPGKVVIHEWKLEDTLANWEKFQLLVKFWQIDKNYYPALS